MPSAPAIRSTASVACAELSQTTTPLPAASPSALTTTGPSSRWVRKVIALAASRKVWKSGLGMSAWRSRFRQNTLLASNSAACFEGPKVRMPASSKASTIPAARGASGPMTARSIWFC